MAHSNTHIERFLDAAQEPTKDLAPIEGYQKKSLMSLEQSLQDMHVRVNNLETMMKIALRNSRKPANGLTSDESAAIHLYTMQWTESHESFYAKLNEALRCQNRKSLIPWFSYLKLLLTALYKLPPFDGTIWRGVRGNLNDVFEEDVIWWGVSSCTEKLSIMEEFLGTDGERTLFNIQCSNGKAIRAHSHFENEEEILLMPGTYLRVVGKYKPSKDLHIIQLREARAPYQTIVPPFVTSSSSSLAPEPLPPQVSVISKKPNIESTASISSTNPHGNAFYFLSINSLRRRYSNDVSSFREMLQEAMKKDLF